MLSPSTINEACTSVGVAKYGRPIGLDEKIKVDIIVIGSVAVDPKTGARLGKGEVHLIPTCIFVHIHIWNDAAFNLLWRICASDWSNNWVCFAYQLNCLQFVEYFCS